ncbi:MAG: alpha-ribazole phosphatase [Schwartzia sp.]|nr:alpha-ribazole phosphatase [Schwartzia sp. (in: firmicutes)]
MIRLFFVRHGETEWNTTGKYQGQSDIALSDKGRRQAEALAAHFPAETLDAVYTSDLKRARVTAEILVNRFGCPLFPDKALQEIHFGDWEGHTYEEIVSKWPEQGANFFRAPEKLIVPHGESFPLLQERAMQKVQAIISENEGNNVAVVAHGAIIRTILATLMHIPLHYLWSIRQDNTAVSILRIDGEFTTIELINSTAHLSRQESL